MTDEYYSIVIVKLSSCLLIIAVQAANSDSSRLIVSLSLRLACSACHHWHYKCHVVLKYGIK